jgi:hypothetical protein
MEFEREEEQAAAEEASHIGGEPYSHEPGEEGDPVAYTEVDGRPAGQTAESYRAVEEGGGGESEGVADRRRGGRPRRGGRRAGRRVRRGRQRAHLRGRAGQ